MRRVFEAGAISRTRIAAETGLTGAAISRITRELLDLGLLEERDFVAEKGRPGRRSVELSLPRGGFCIVGIGAGAFEQWIRVATIDGNLLYRRALKLAGLNGDNALQSIVKELHDLLGNSQLSGMQLVGCGIAIAGITDPATGVVVNSPNFGWRNLPFASVISAAIGVRSRIESLHHALHLAEGGLGGNVGYGDTLLVNAALGIGASVISNGTLVRGGHSIAGQIGHIPVKGATEICTCGRRGCLDTVASGHAVLTSLDRIARRARPSQHGRQDADLLRQAITAASKGDKEAGEAFYTAGRELGTALAAIRMVTDPGRLVLAGPLAQVSQYVEGARDAFVDGALQGDERPDLVISEQQVDAAGAWVAMDSFVISDRMDPDTFRMLT